MRARPALLILPFSFSLTFVLAGCPTDRLPPAKEAHPLEDEWSKIAPSKEWLFATSEFSGPHKAECDHVVGWVKGEEACKASLCEHGRELAGEWITRCGGLEEPAMIESVRQLQARLATKSAEAPTECAKRFDAMVVEGCGEDATCFATGQRWATRCAKSEGTPLVMRILSRTLERKQEGGASVQLDVRTCDELRADVMEAGKCKDRLACAEAVPRVEVYRERCESATERPTLGTAVAELTVLVSGNKPVQPVRVREGSTSLAAGEVPVMLADGSGGVIHVCEERVVDLARYVSARKACKGGTMVVARAFPAANGVEVRVGALDFPDDATFSARYPTIVATGELEMRDAESAAALGLQLSKAAELARSASSASDAARLAANAVITHALAITRSATARAVLAKADGELAPALKEIGKAKLAAARGVKVPAADVSGLLERARTRAFADVTSGGEVEIGAAGRGLTLQTSTLLPRAMEAYAAALKGAPIRRVDARTVKAEKARGVAAAGACGAWEKKLVDSKKSLVSCNFGLESCDPAKQAALGKAVDDARLAAERAFHDLEIARTGGAAAEAQSITAAAEAASCRAPWW